MKNTLFILAIMANLLLINFNSAASSNHAGEHNEHQEESKGPNNGKMLIDGDFALELTLFEQGVPPEYRVYPSYQHKKLNVNDVSVTVVLTRLGDIKNRINFHPVGDFLRGDTTVVEPHSFAVEVIAKYQGKQYQWQYENFEGRTKISHEMAKQMGVKTSVVTSQQLTESLQVYGKLVLAPNAQRQIYARFPGLVTQLNVELGQQVNKGELLMVVESDESLQRYNVYAPISGVVSEQNISQGEQSANNRLLTISDTSQLIAELNVYPLDQQKVKLGANVSLLMPAANTHVKSQLFDSLIATGPQQEKIYRTKVDNQSGKLSVGEFVEANIAIDSFTVPLAVKRDALQSFRDFTVVYEKIGQQYEVRMLTLGREAGDWVEVLSGISAGSEYVESNSYLIKADIDKAGAAHDH